MKKYTKPMVNVVSLKSSDDIASFKAIQKTFINDYLYTNKSKDYTVSQYSTFDSSTQDA